MPRIASMENAYLYHYTKEVVKMGEYIGVDVGNTALDICYTGKVIRIANTVPAINKWIKDIAEKMSIEIIVCEATGEYERPFVNLLRKSHIPIFVEHANKIRAFAKSKGLLAKTDHLDSQLIADYARMMQPKPKEYHLSEKTSEIRELLKRRDQLIEDKGRETARLDKQY